MTQKGPLKLKTVGAVEITVQDEWACLLNKANRSKKFCQGVTADRITSTFPRIDVSQAVAEMKGDDVNNGELQRMKIPKFGSGEPDVLLGMLYKKCHPVTLHTLPSGVFIAKLLLASHDDLYDGVIGGPHMIQ